MKANLMTCAMLLGTTALAACSGGGGSGGGGSPIASRSGNAPAQQVLAETAGNAAEALEDGTTLRASQRASAGWTRNFENATAAPNADTTATVTSNGAGGLNLTINGRTIQFTAAMLTDDGYGFILPDESAGIFAQNGESMADALDPNADRYSLAFDYFYDNDNETGANGYVVVGTETAAGDLTGLPTATYEGYARFRVAPTTGFEDFGQSVSDVEGEVNLTANFGAGEVSGNVTDLALRQPRLVDPTRAWTPFGGELTLETAAIDGNGFTGGITADAGFTSEIGTISEGSTYSGTFFGPDADEVGGGINLTGTEAGAGGGAYVGQGYWQAYKD